VIFQPKSATDAEVGAVKNQIKKKVSGELKKTMKIDLVI
jgi:hypothetical protein